MSLTTHRRHHHYIYTASRGDSVTLGRGCLCAYLGSDIWDRLDGLLGSGWGGGGGAQRPG